MKKLSIILPVYNEKDFLELVLKRIEDVDWEMQTEIILVDDASTDGTKELYKKFDYKVICHDKNMGKGAAIKTGLKNATGDIIVIQDADLEYNPVDYKSLIALIKNGTCEVVYGSRFLKKENFKNFLILSFLANKFLTFLTKIMYKTEITDMETCYKAFRADVIRNIDIKSNRFDFEPEVTAKILKQGIKIAELPIGYDGRDFNKGKKITWKDGLRAIWILFINLF